jgi:uncharacterized Fe-S cluster protein YjdI
LDNVTKKYSNGEVTVVWQPHECIHSGICFRGLNEVFNPKKRPWISLNGSTTDKIVEQVRKCPSGALSYELKLKTDNDPAENPAVIVQPLLNGPLMMQGHFIIRDPSGADRKIEKPVALCRCGASANKPFCDGTHEKIGFVS